MRGEHSFNKAVQFVILSMERGKQNFVDAFIYYLFYFPLFISTAAITTTPMMIAPMPSIATIENIIVHSSIVQFFYCAVCSAESVPFASEGVSSSIPGSALLIVSFVISESFTSELFVSSETGSVSSMIDSSVI